MKALRGWTSGLAVPHFVIDAPGIASAFEASMRRVEVKLRASDLTLRFLPRDQHPADGVFTVGFESLEDAYRELLRFGPDAEVLEPVEVITTSPPGVSG